MKPLFDEVLGITNDIPQPDHLKCMEQNLHITNQFPLVPFHFVKWRVFKNGDAIEGRSAKFTLLGYGMITSEKNNCFIKNNQEILLDFADFALQEQPEDNLVVAISRACCNGHSTIQIPVIA